MLVAGAGPNAVLGDLAPAEQARLAYLDEGAHRVAFRHPLIRATVVELSNAKDRRDAHRLLAKVWYDQPDRRVWHLAEATVEPDELVAGELEAAAARILARGDAVGCVKVLTRASEVSPGTADRRRRMAAAAYIGADVAGDLSHAAHVLGDLRRGDTEVEGSLQAAVAASSFLLMGDGDVATAHRVLAGALEGRHGILDARDPVIAEALYSLINVCGYGDDERLWKSFEDAMARSVSIPLVLQLSASVYADPARAADPTHIIRIAVAATYVDRLEGCRPAALGRSDFEEAYRLTSMISPPGVIAPHHPGALYVLMDLVEAALRTGREAEAAAHVAAMRDANLPALSSRLALVVGGSAAMVATDDSALQLFEVTLALPGIQRCRFDLARVRLAYGECLRRRRAIKEARLQLNAAREIFEHLGARPWIDRTTTELRATGQTKPGVGDTVSDRLTSQEFEIVSLQRQG